MHGGSGGSDTAAEGRCEAGGLQGLLSLRGGSAGGGGLLACRSGGDVEQFSVGDVSVRTGGGSQGCETAAAMRRQAAAMMAGFCGDDEFAFLGVRG